MRHGFRPGAPGDHCPQPPRHPPPQHLTASAPPFRRTRRPPPHPPPPQSVAGRSRCRRRPFTHPRRSFPRPPWRTAQPVLAFGSIRFAGGYPTFHSRTPGMHSDDREAGMHPTTRLDQDQRANSAPLRTCRHRPHRKERGGPCRAPAASVPTNGPTPVTSIRPLRWRSRSLTLRNAPSPSEVRRPWCNTDVVTATNSRRRAEGGGSPQGVN